MQTQSLRAKLWGLEKREAEPHFADWLKSQKAVTQTSQKSYSSSISLT